jgi:hypothetical protein
MPVCKTCAGTDGYRFYTQSTTEERNYKIATHYKITFRKDGALHRVDGPAIIEFYTYPDGSSEIVSELYYIKGYLEHKDIIEYVNNIPFDKLPLHISKRGIKEVVAARLMDDTPLVLNQRPSPQINKILDIIGVKNISKLLPKDPNKPWRK